MAEVATSLHVVSAEPCLLLDDALVVVDVNAPAADLLGVDPDGALGTPLSTLVDARREDGGRAFDARDPLLRLGDAGFPAPAERLRLRRRSGGERTVRARMLGVEQGGRRWLVLLLDPGAPSEEETAASEEPVLTARQQEVLDLLAAGLPCRVIARELHVSEATTRNHIRAILVALDSHSQLEAVARARRLGLFDDRTVRPGRGRSRAR